ncbi:MAG: cytochrome c biogenesis protein CcsA, partial [Verrucomicrobiales bacterium]|nr:cytochrome c biogenesis protein CcsA [Verrucomicrobiales bacterium]
MTAFSRSFFALIFLLASGSFARSVDLPDPALFRDAEVVDAFRSVPIQQDGRIKPLDTYARFLLLRLSGHQSLKVQALDGGELASLPGVKKLDAMQFLLLAWFRPDIVRELPVLVVDNSQAVGEVDVEPQGLRDRYSWSELNPAREKLRQKLEEYSQIDSKKLTPIQRQVVDLGRNFFDFDAVLDYLESPRTDWRAEAKDALPAEVIAALPQGDQPWTVWELAKNLGTFIRTNGPAALPQEKADRLLNLMINKTVRPGMTVALIPPADPEELAWLKIGDLVTNVMQEETVPESELRIAQQRDDLVAAAAGGQESLRQATLAFVKDIRDQAEARGELKHVDMEVSYYHRDFFTNALVWYLLGFLLAVLGLLAPASKFSRITGWLAAASMVAGWVMNTWGITVRCLITERPPIATLYETILFITATIALVCLLLEMVLKNRFALALGGLLGALGMLMSYLFMALDAQDTMPTLQAVLITNFWLATHVIAINIGYAGCLLASVISMVWVGWRVVTRGRGDREVSRLFTRVVYGVTCFGLLFALVGTVLGGIWANDSWGRFWGWDPKENGALMIVLMGLVILHSRLGGIVKVTGLHQLSLLMGIVTVFSWFGVNQLGLGLHSYGFTDGIWRALFTTWSIQGAFMLAEFV